MLASIVVLIITTLPLIFYRGYFLPSNAAIAQNLGGAAISVLVLPFFGLLYLYIKSKKGISFCLIVFLFGHIAANQMATYATLHPRELGLFGSLYASIIVATLMFVPLAVVHYFLMSDEKEIDKRFLDYYRNLRFMPLVITMYGLFYGFTISRFIIDYYKYQNETFITLASILFCFAVISLVIFVMVLRYSDLVVDALVEHKKQISKIDLYVVLTGVAFILLSAIAEYLRGNWSIWFAITITAVAILGIELKIVRRAVTQVQKQPTSNVFSDNFVKVYSVRFFVYNLIAYLIVFSVLTSIAVFSSP